MKCSLIISNFLFFPCSLFTFIFLHYSLKKTFLSLLAILWNSAFSWVYLFFPPLPYFLFFSQLFVKPPQITTLLSCISFSLAWFWLLPSIQCYEPLSVILQALFLPDLIPWIYLSPPLYNHKDLIYVIPELDFLDGSDGKESTYIAEDLSLIPGVGRSHGGGHGNPL